MKQTLTTFDFEDAFKALSELTVPEQPGKIKPTQLAEQMSRADKFEALFEDYYNINDGTDLEAAQNARDKEIAQAKLTRIEQIVDLDAKTEDDILPSYVGKMIVQCPQCMTLFYKKAEDLEQSEEDNTIVNKGEKCQHCGNEDGYKLIGKVAETEVPENELPAEEGQADNTEELNVDTNADMEQVNDLEAVPEESQNENPETEDDLNQAAQEAFNFNTGDLLNEEIDKDLNVKLEEHNDYIDYLQKQIEAKEQELAQAKNEFIKVAIQKTIDNLNNDLDAAVPAEVKGETPVVTETPDEAMPDNSEELSTDNAEDADIATESKADNEKTTTESLHESKLSLTEEELPALTDSSFEKLLNSPEFQEPISDDEVRSYLDQADENEDLAVAEDLDEQSINKALTESLTNAFINIKTFEATDCTTVANKLLVEGKINFKSGKAKKAIFTFNKLPNEPVLECLTSKNSKHPQNLHLKYAYALSADKKSLCINKIIL